MPQHGCELWVLWGNQGIRAKAVAARPGKWGCGGKGKWWFCPFAAKISFVSGTVLLRGFLGKVGISQAEWECHRCWYSKVHISAVMWLLSNYVQDDSKLRNTHGKKSSMTKHSFQSKILLCLIFTCSVQKCLFTQRVPLCCFEDYHGTLIEKQMEVQLLLHSTKTKRRKDADARIEQGHFNTKRLGLLRCDTKPCDVRVVWGPSEGVLLQGRVGEPSCSQMERNRGHKKQGRAARFSTVQGTGQSHLCLTLVWKQNIRTSAVASLP